MLSKYVAAAMVKTSTTSTNVLVLSSRLKGEEHISLSEDYLDKLRHLIRVRWEGVYDHVLNRTQN